MESIRLHDKTVGISAAVIFDQEMIWSKGFGVVDKNLGGAPSPDTLFRIGSISKLFTTIEVFSAVLAGFLAFNERCSPKRC